MKQHVEKIKKGVKKLKISLREKKRLSSVQRSYGLYFQAGLVTVLLVVFGLFQMKFEKKDVVVRKSIIDMYSDDNIVPPEFIIEREPPKLLDQVQRVHIQELTTIMVVDDDADVLPVVIYDSSAIPDRVPRVIDIEVEEMEEVVEPIPISLVSDMPVYPGCEIFTDKKKLVVCMSQKIKKHIKKVFNTEIANEYGISGRQKVLVTFVINTKGQVVNVRARAAHPELKKEVIKVVSSLPNMKPAKQGFKVVSVTYALPVVFQVE
ncbi:MAG: energy transducer TonB [Flavobacteriaceae bacterium]|nr:energy transducer TonB [Flavobacteriaceae bacterium]